MKTAPNSRDTASSQEMPAEHTGGPLNGETKREILDAVVVETAALQTEQVVLLPCVQSGPGPAVLTC